MTICNKCGRKLPNNARCFCKSPKKEGVKISENKIIGIYGEPKDFENLKGFNTNVVEYTINLWKELHTYKWISKEEAVIWFVNWKQRIPCGDCKKHFEVILETNPPDFTSKELFFIWGVKVHNIVNERLNKKIVSLEEAKTMWNYDNPV